MTFPSEPGPLDGPGLRTETVWGCGEAVVVVAGEIDLSTVAVLRAEAARCLARRPPRFAIDVTGVRFCDCAGVHALCRAADAARGAGIGFRLIGPDTALRRLLTLAGAADLLPRRRDGEPVTRTSEPGTRSRLDRSRSASRAAGDGYRGHPRDQAAAHVSGGAAARSGTAMLPSTGPRGTPRRVAS